MSEKLFERDYSATAMVTEDMLELAALLTQLAEGGNKDKNEAAEVNKYVFGGLLLAEKLHGKISLERDESKLLLSVTI